MRSISVGCVWCIALGTGVAPVGATAQHSEDRYETTKAPRDDGAWDAADLPLPDMWLPAKGNQCKGRGRKRSCQGPRRVPAPHGPDAELAQSVGLGTLKAAVHLLLEAPLPQWVEAAGHTNDEGLHWPVDGGRLWRGMDPSARDKPVRHRKTRSNTRHHRHLGVDIGAAEGSPIHAVKSGIVAYSDNGVRGYGNLLMTIHPDGTVAFYAHCRAVFVFAGQRITQGQVVGETGSTGITRGPHLHFEYRVDGKPHDPLPLFDKAPEPEDE